MTATEHRSHGGIAGGERRHLTVLFSDLVGSTALASTFDPEDWGDVVRQYHTCVDEAVARFGGHVAEHLGDGVVAYFGWPLAHGNDPERAVRTGLAIVEAALALGRRLDLPLHVRVGIETGPVVIDEHGVGFGEPMNVAARVQAIAETDTVLITAATHRLVAGLFVVDDGGTHALKGVPKPVTVHRVRGASGVRGRLAAAAAHGLTPYVGRDAERRVLRDRWQRARDGRGHVVLVVGEPGIGKSRLLEQFRQELGGTPHTWIETAGSPFFQNTPLYPITDMLQQFVAVAADASATERVAALERALGVTAMPLAESVPLVAPLLGLPVPDRYPPLLASPDQQRAKLLATVVGWAVAAARMQPLVVVVEDLQWIDASTAEVLRLLASHAASVPLLLLLTARTDYQPPRPLPQHHTELVLTRLAPTLVREMAARVAAAAALSPELLDAVVSRTDGVPLFVEELTKTIVESGAGVAARDIPVTLHDSLMARLDRLGDAKEVAQVASVLGREFDHRLLLHVYGLAQASDTAEPALTAALAKLADAELLFARGAPPHATYAFKHALVQDTAYASLLKRRRRELHRATAQVLTERFPERAELQPELLAHHHTEAGDAAPAAAAWQAAGERALLRSAREAVAHLRRGIAVVAAVADGAARAQQELALQLRLGQALQATVGYGSEEVAAAFARTKTLTDQLGTGSQDMFLLLLLWTNTFSWGELQGARQIADRLLEIGVRDGARPVETWAHVTQACTHYHGGDYAVARKHADRAVGLYRVDEHRTAPQDPGTSALAYGALAAFQLGFADQARRYVDEAVALAQRLETPFNTVWTQFYDAFVAHHGRDFARVLLITERILPIAREHQFAFFVSWSEVIRGWALAESGDVAAGLALLRGALGALDRMTHHVGTGVRLACLGHVLALAGDVDAALRTIDDALSVVREQRSCRPELLYERATIRARAGAPTGEVHAGYEAALAAADDLDARFWGLRCATGLARLLAAEGRRRDAVDVLAPRYAWFTEGFGCRDLVEARALLDELQ